MTGSPLLPPPWEQKPLEDGEIARWLYRTGNGATLTLVVLASDGRAGVELWSGPGLCHAATTDPGDLWALADALDLVANWLYDRSAPPRPVVGQPSPFDEVPV